MRGRVVGRGENTHTHTLPLLIPGPSHGTFENKQGNVGKVSGITSRFLGSGEDTRQEFKHTARK